MNIDEIESLVDKALEDNDMKHITSININDIKEDIFGDSRVTKLVKDIISKKDAKVFEELKKIKNVSAHFSEELENHEFSDTRMIDLLTSQYEGNVENFSEEYEKLITDSYKNKSLKDVYSELKEIEVQFSTDVSKLVELSIVNPAKIQKAIEGIPDKLVECYPYKTNVKMEVVEDMLKSALKSDSDFKESWANFSNFIQNKSLKDIQTIQAHFSRLDVVGLAKVALEKVEASEVQSSINPAKGELAEVSTARPGDIIKFGGTIHEVKFNGGSEVETEMYQDLSAFFSADEAIATKIPSNKKVEFIKKQTFEKEVGNNKDLKEGVEFIVEGDEHKGKVYHVISKIDDNTVKVSDGKDEFELKIESEDDLKKIKLRG